MLIVGAILSVLAAVLMTVITSGRLKPRTGTIPTPPPLSFAGVAESAIPGRYKWIEPGQESFIELLNDHTFRNKEGNIFPMYRWESSPNGLSITWSQGTDYFTNIEAAGIYQGAKANGRIIRLEKQAFSDQAEWPPSARPGLAASINSNNLVGSLHLDDVGQTNRLTVVNTGNGDGRIFTTIIDGTECFQLVRKPKRPEAYLYVRIDPNLKEPAFTNAAVLVEYFDIPPTDSRTGFISIQYDAPAGPYTRVAQRVRLTGAEKWKQTIFFLDNPLFQNRQNSGGDFRLCILNPELPVRSIKLAKNIP